MSEIAKQVGLLIREARQAKGLTQKELGTILGISIQAVNRYEFGQNLTIDTLSKIAQALDVSMSDLVKDQKKNEV